ncbi:11s globulin subunit beta [Nicotiana attenuata]|uniref:11s globulin subunit beta n=1 Tax=Nicotiana attenuata TaxID=49451 RepID=A0A1J6JN73_NICAT|nr:11s globulin subunit beta [Nicotiana attenuata]
MGDCSSGAMHGVGGSIESSSSQNCTSYIGSGIAGVVLPGQEEKVVAIRKGDAIALPVGIVTWWYNKDVTELEILFLGDTKTAVKLGSFADFLLKGSNGNNLSCFSPEFIGRAWKSDKSILKTLVGLHLARSIVKLVPGFEISEAELKDYRDGMLLNCEETAPSRSDTNGGGEILDLNTENLPIIGDIGLGASRATLNGNAAYYPEISVDPAIRVTDIIKGSGRVKVRDFCGFVTERQIEVGELFVVPRLLSVLKIADPEGMEWFSIVTNENSNNYLTLGRWGLISDSSIPKSSSSPGYHLGMTIQEMQQYCCPIFG